MEQNFKVSSKGEYLPEEEYGKDIKYEYDRGCKKLLWRPAHWPLWLKGFVDIIALGWQLLATRDIRLHRITRPLDIVVLRWCMYDHFSRRWVITSNKTLA